MTVFLLAASILSACATTVDPVPVSAGSASPSAGPDAAPPVLESLPDFPGSVVATPEIPWEPPPRMNEGDTIHDTVASLLIDLRRIWDTEELEVRVGLLGEPTDDTAEAFLQAAVVGDDSVAGTEILFELRRGRQGWYMINAQVRAHCRRAMDLDTGFCV